MSETVVKKCPHCFGEIDPRASRCRHCGQSIKTANPIYALGTLVMAFGLLVFLGGFIIDPLVIIFGLAAMGAGAVIRIAARG